MNTSATSQPLPAAVPPPAPRPSWNDEIKPGEFPFRLTGGVKESPFLTWLRNHSKYMAVRGLLDYFRITAVLVRGILLNNLVLLPLLLLIAIVFSLVYSGLLSDWDAQATPELRRVAMANDAIADLNMRKVAAQAALRDNAGNTAAAAELAEAEMQLVTARANFNTAKSSLDTVDWKNVPIQFFLTRKTISEDVGWVTWLENHFGLSPPFLLTPVALVLAAGWVLLFPMVMLLLKIAGYQRSLATGSDSSVRWRDSYERTFAWVVLVVVGVALLELLPLLVHYYHRVRVAHLGERLQGKELFALGTVLLGALSRAPSLLSSLGGAWKTVAVACVGFASVFVPVAVIVIVSEFLVFVPMPYAENWPTLKLGLLIAPAFYLVGFLVATGIGLRRRAFDRKECLRVLALLGLVVAAHVALLGAFTGIYRLVHWLYLHHPSFALDVLLAVPGLREDSFEKYGDLAFYFVAAGALEIWFFCWLTVDINLTSAHGLYRDRLASAYLLGLNQRGQVDIEEDIDLEELCCRPAGSIAPYHLINVALNLQGSRDIGLRDRRSDFFIFSPQFIGGERTGYCRSTTMEEVFPQMDVATAMAISAAAASPNAGRETSPALVAFLTMLNVRLGVWVPNPGRLEEALAGRKAAPDGQAEPEGQKPGFRFDEVFAAELDSIAQRWKRLGAKGERRRLADTRRPTAAHHLAGIGFSGGGIRSATINLGIAQVLHRAGVFDHFDYMSTVSGGGYLGSSLSTFMRYRTPPLSEIGGRVSITATPAAKVVTVTPTEGETRQPREYHYTADAGLAVREGDVVRAGTRLLRRPGCSRRSEIAGTVSIEKQADGSRLVRVDPTDAGATSRTYFCSRYDRLTVEAGKVVAAGDTLVARSGTSFGDRFRWRVRPVALWHEMTMRLDETHRWVNLSDGGHIENLATIELLRRRCKLIVIGDGEADPQLAFNGLATLMRTARIDLGIHIEICLDPLRLGPPGLDGNRCSRAHFAIGRITYPAEAGETEPGCGYLLYLKSSYTGDEDDVIGEYRRRCPAFPHESTADQFFDEGQFEAYRALGQHIGEKALEAVGFRSAATREEEQFAELLACFEQHWKRETKIKPDEAAAALLSRVLRDAP